MGLAELQKNNVSVCRGLKGQKMNESTDQILGLTAQIVSAHVRHNTVAPDALPGLDPGSVQDTANIGKQPVQAEKPTPAVPVKQSIRQDRIICLEDGKSFSMLKRHLMTDHKLTPQQYREKWGLPRDYPDGGAELCADAVRAGQEDRARAQGGGRPKRGGRRKRG